jgi:hypothetical protein
VDLVQLAWLVVDEQVERAAGADRGELRPVADEEDSVGSAHASHRVTPRDRSAANSADGTRSSCLKRPRSSSAIGTPVASARVQTLSHGYRNRPVKDEPNSHRY